jgi:hypothetical protein
MVNFFFGEQPVGHFTGEGYPSQSGRFEYSPFRGMGHANIAATLRRGEVARCWFERDEKRVAFDVSREEFAPGEPGGRSKWYIEVVFLDEPHAPAEGI